MMRPHLFKMIFNKNGVFLFSLLKYVEFVFVALTNILLARQLGPVEMSFSIPVFLYITYSNYLCLGVNQVIVKRYGLEDEAGQDSLFRCVFHLICIACLGAFLFSVLVLERSFAFLAAGISSMVFLRSYFLTYYRLKNKMFILNINSIVYASLLCILTLTCVHSFRDYLICWNISLLCVLFMYMFSDIKHLRKYICLSNMSKTWIEYGNIIKIGIKLSFVTILVTIFLTNDKFFINQYSIDVAIKGSYQLADNIGVALYMVVTTIIYYYYPSLMVKLRNLEFRKIFVRKILYLLLAIPLIILFVWLGMFYIGCWLFPNFDSLDIFVPVIVLYKLLIVVLTLLSTIYIVDNKEIEYIFSSIIIVVMIIGTSFLFMYLQYPLVYIPIVSSLFVFCYILLLIYRIHHGISKDTYCI